jgi:pantetheine-phosphate adenylyltransferase
MSAAANKTALYAGSFDPITLGHMDIIQRIAKLYDEVIVLVADSAEKRAMFTASERVSLIQKCLAGLSNVRVDIHSGLTVNYARKNGAQILIRGLRGVIDFEYERNLGNINRTLAPKIETVLVFASPEYYSISSSLVKDVAKHQGPLQGLVPEAVIEAISKRL